MGEEGGMSVEVWTIFKAFPRTRFFFNIFLNYGKFVLFSLFLLFKNISFFLEIKNIGLLDTLKIRDFWAQNGISKKSPQSKFYILIKISSTNVKLGHGIAKATIYDVALFVVFVYQLCISAMKQSTVPNKNAQ